MCCFANIFIKKLTSFFVDKCSFYLACLWKSSDIFGEKKITAHYSSIAISYVKNSFYRITCQDRVSTAYTDFGTKYAFK